MKSRPGNRADAAVAGSHALLWWLTDDPQLSSPARAAIEDLSNDIFVSAASAWEIATKQRIGKLSGLVGVMDRYVQVIAADGFQHLPMNHLHALQAGGFPQPHRDPFDRMLAAQSEIEQMPLVTRDPAFAAFNTRTIW